MIQTKTVQHSKFWHIKRWFATGQAYIYLLPAFIVLALFSYGPAAFVFYMSLFKWSFLNQGTQPFIGLGNFDYLFHSSTFWHALQTTILYVVISVPLQMALALFLALCLMAGIRAKAFWRLVIFSPFITPMVATTAIWYWMFDPYHGLFDGILRLLHLHPIDWLGDPHWTLFSIILYTIWKSAGFSVVLFMAGLGNIPPDLREAARVDGANSWQVLRRITWPLLTPITLVVLLLGTIEAFKMFQPAFLLVGPVGGAGNAANTLGLYLFSEGFSTDPHDGRGAAISVVLFALVFIISVVQLRISRRGVETID
ncbi:ABC transporter permease [Dictyobacter sp. S3.2.2.5]|uniref:ABC transporter permease n=1 Tax=Dictyobacter halimunensis TaxID=3026934 RepID=A0ABQ6G3A5_9CHLR|nr:ABC transporter permease [Dictyobacter sp. S3.2.2.5]